MAQFFMLGFMLYALIFVNILHIDAGGSADVRKQDSGLTHTEIVMAFQRSR